MTLRDLAARLEQDPNLQRFVAENRRSVMEAMYEWDDRRHSMSVIVRAEPRAFHEIKITAKDVLECNAPSSVVLSMVMGTLSHMKATSSDKIAIYEAIEEKTP